MTPVSVLELVASSRGGGAVHVRDLALALDTSRFAVQVAMAEDGGNVGREDFTGAAIPFHRLDIAAGFSLAAIVELRRLLRGVRILHMHGARAALFGRLAALSLGRQHPRVIYSIHGFAAPHYPAPRKQLLLAVERLLTPVTDLWICVSHAEREALLASGVAAASRVRVIWNGIEVERFVGQAGPGEQVRAALHVPPAAFVLTTICRLFRPRDFPTLLHAFRQVQDSLPRAHLWIVGDGPLRSEVERLVAALHLQDHVDLLGMRRDVPAILGATNVLVLSSRGWEGLPLTVLEAMASSVPVVASDVGGTREAVLHGETGWLFPPGDADALAQHVLAVANDPAQARLMGQRGLARVRELFTVQRMAQQTAAVYQQVLS